MKYGDQPGVGVSILVDATAETLWTLVSDPMTPAQFENELVEARWENAPNGPELGATFRGYNHHPDLGWTWDVECTINRFDHGRLFGWAPGDAAQWWFTLEPTGEQTRVWFHATIGPGPSGLTPAIEAQPDREDDIVANRLASWRENMERTLVGIKELAETPR